MKKPLILLSALLLVIFVIFSAIDRSEYVVEKKMWKIQQQLDVLGRYPGAMPAEKYENLAAMYQNLIKRYPKSSLLPQIYIKIGQVYTAKNDFVKARTNYSEVLQRFPQQRDSCSVALLSIGLTYEKEKKDAQALKTYRKIVTNYHLTDVGLSMPIYIAAYYRRLNKDAEAESAFREAEGFYLKATQENHNSLAGFNALRLLAETYLDQKKWDDAVKIFEKVLFDYSRSPYLDWKTAGSMIYSINAVSIKELKDHRRPIAFYQMFIEKQPGHPLNKVLKKVIVSLQDSKSGKKAEVKR